MPFNKMVLDPAQAYIERGDMVARANDAFAAAVPGYAVEKKQIADALKPLTDQIVALEAAGKDITVADQMAREVGWLRKYTADFARARARLADLRALLADLPSIPFGQDAEGSWGPGCTEPYRKLEATVDQLQAIDPSTPGLRPLLFMKRWQEPKRLLSELWRLQVTDIAVTKVNCRDELGSVQSSISQLFFKDGLRESINAAGLGFEIDDALVLNYADYLEQTQHPRTGYWGPWYRFDGELFRVQDLSFTYHVISYRSGDVARWPTIIDTTLDIEDIEYPGGWFTHKDPDPAKVVKFSHHHNYDVAAIFAWGWPHIDAARKVPVRDAVTRMLTWCLTESIEPGGGFKPDGGLLATTYYYGVRFLDKVGYWDPMKRFWGRDLPVLPGYPVPGALGKRLKEKFAVFQADQSPEARTTRLILNMAAAIDD
ncbi:MAG: hypothetical protein U1E60_20965 [Reyranellaceae bacterium]